MLRKYLMVSILCTQLVLGFPVVAEPSLTTIPPMVVNSEVESQGSLEHGSASTGPSLISDRTDVLNRASSLAKELTGRRMKGASESEAGPVGRGAEYISGYFSGAVLIPVQLWGGVRYSGLHHIPVQTSLYKLITLAGGPTADADLSQLTINRQGKSKSQVIRLNVDEMMSEGTSPPVLEPNDVIVVPTKKPLIDNNTTAVVGLVAGILGIVVSGFIISNQLHR